MKKALRLLAGLVIAHALYIDRSTFPKIWQVREGTKKGTRAFKIATVRKTVPPPRYSHGATVFKDKMWIAGGHASLRFLNYRHQESDRFGDVWYSVDGDIWTQVT